MISVESHLLGEYVGRGELAEQLGKSPRTLARWEQMRVGPPVTQVGRAPYYRVEAVRAWLKSRERPMVREEGCSTHARHRR
jgi:transcriptional regulator with XRE-family HTH domain